MLDEPGLLLRAERRLDQAEGSSKLIPKGKTQAGQMELVETTATEAGLDHDQAQAVEKNRMNVVQVRLKESDKLR
jgi:hypothetical protein